MLKIVHLKIQTLYIEKNIVSFFCILYLIICPKLSLGLRWNSLFTVIDINVFIFVPNFNEGINI